MRFYRASSVACVSIGLILTLAIAGSGVAVSYFVAKRLSYKAKSSLADLLDWILNTNFTMPSFHKDVVINSQAVSVQIDISQVVDPLLDLYKQFPLPLQAPIINRTIETVVNTPAMVIPVQIDSITISLLSILGEEMVDNINSVPESVSDVAYYLLLAVGIVMTLVICDAVIDKVLLGGTGLWLKADIKKAVHQEPGGGRP